MELIRLSENQFYTCQRFGNDKNGNGIYLVNVFEESRNGYISNITLSVAGNRSVDKNGL